jgi:hypothetical protein
MSPPAQAPSALIALLVGINHYANPQVPPLHGCRNGVEAKSQLLRQCFGVAGEAPRTLLDDDATHGAIQKAFREHLIDTARRWHEAGRRRPAPAFLFHFSGHGSSHHLTGEGSASQ